MTYRHPEAAAIMRAEALSGLTANLPPEIRPRAEELVTDLHDRYGPVVTAYPVWHPFMMLGLDTWPGRISETSRHPDTMAGYPGIDHPFLFHDAILAVLYPHSLEEYRATLHRIQERWLHPREGCPSRVHRGAFSLDVQEFDPKEKPLYAENGFPVLLTCQWNTDPASGTEGVGPSLAFIMYYSARWLLRQAEYSEVAEDWATVSPYLLGSPHGAVSSPFISEDVGYRLRTMVRALNDSGMFGPRLLKADDPSIQESFRSRKQHPTTSEID